MHNLLLMSLMGVLLNMILSLTVPILLKDSKDEYMVKLRNYFENNKNNFLLSSLYVGIMIFVSCKVLHAVKPLFKKSSCNSNSGSMRFFINSDDGDNFNMQNLIKLSGN